MKYSKKYKMYYRDEDDELVMYQGKNYHKIFSDGYKGTVLDIGAHIGVFSKIAKDYGCKKIIAVEPNKDNFKYLIINILDAIFIKRAVTDDPDLIKKGFCFINPCQHHYAYRINRQSTSKATLYGVIGFRELIDRYKPNIIKIDIEGEEYHFNFNNLPQYVKKLVIEMHIYDKTDIDQYNMYMNLINQGFKSLIPNMEEEHLKRNKTIVAFLVR